MCLIAFAWQAHPQYDLIVAANRDEFYERPTRAAHWWPEADAVYGGRDRRAGGAWCAVDGRGRFAAVTNVREQQPVAGVRSRGELVYDALLEAGSLPAYAQATARQRQNYGPFNLLLADHQQLLFLSNRGNVHERMIEPGLYAISNGHWEEHWPKTGIARERLQALLDADNVTSQTLFSLLAPATLDAAVPTDDVTVGPNTEQLRSALFVHSPVYGTRASTIILRDRAGHVDFHERTFDHDAQVTSEQHEHWSLT